MRGTVDFLERLNIVRRLDELEQWRQSSADPGIADNLRDINTIFDNLNNNIVPAVNAAADTARTSAAEARDALNEVIAIKDQLLAAAKAIKTDAVATKDAFATVFTTIQTHIGKIKWHFAEVAKTINALFSGMVYNMRLLRDSIVSKTGDINGQMKVIKWHIDKAIAGEYRLLNVMYAVLHFIYDPGSKAWHDAYGALQRSEELAEVSYEELDEVAYSPSYHIGPDPKWPAVMTSLTGLITDLKVRFLELFASAKTWADRIRDGGAGYYGFKDINDAFTNAGNDIVRDFNTAINSLTKLFSDLEVNLTGD